MTSESVRPSRNIRGGRGAGGRRTAPAGLFGMVPAKKRATLEERRSKVYTSQMFQYKENLDERKPTERKMRSRRKKSED